ncbi:MAG: Flp pilus assembly complex ATPase component TadA [Lachnospiraceae bacterium]|nr:Flp pilus assembly complex ATPase component TadA [Lachnospiraceae bacterium]
MAKYRRLGELLIDAGAITNDQLEQALAIQKETKERLGEALINHGFMSEDQLIDALTMQLGIEYIDLTKVQIPIDLAQAVPKSMAKQYSVVPVQIVRDELFLAMSDPMNFYAIEDVRKSSRKRVVPMVARKASVDYAIQVLYGNEGAAKAIEEMKMESAASGDTVSATQSSAFVTNVLGEDSAANAPTIRLVNSIIERAVDERASDIHVEPREENLHVRMRIDGIMREILTVPKDLMNSVISRIKVMSGMDTSEKRIPQDGRFNVRAKGKDIDLRVSTLPTVYGEKIVARLLDKSDGRVTKEKVGLTGRDEEIFDKLMTWRNGVILLVGPTGSGKTTTMYAMINELNKPEVNMITLEDPVEYNVDGVNQVQINEKTGMTFAAGLRAILRQDPDIVAVGEIRDGETATIAMRAAITGRLVLSTIHTNDAVGTVERLYDIGVEPYLTASALRGIISQRLVRRICPHCKEEYEPTDEELTDLALPKKPGQKFFRGAGCPDCFNTGYRGRAAIFEMMPINSNVRSLISENARRGELEAALKDSKSGFVSMRENAIRLMLEGITTVEEVLRVTNEED